MNFKKYFQIIPILTILLGIVLFLTGLIAYQTRREYFLGLTTYTPENNFIKENPGVKKFLFSAETNAPQKISIPLCANDACDSFNEVVQYNGLAYGYVKYDRVEVVKNEDGTFKEDWVTKVIDDSWAEFTLSNDVRFSPDSGAITAVEGLEEEIIEDVYLDGLEPPRTFDREVSERVGDTRVILKYIEADPSTTLLGGGNLRGEVIESGEPFFVTNVSEAEFAERFENDYSPERTVFYIASAFFIALGMYFALVKTKLSEVIVSPVLFIGLAIISSVLIFFSVTISAFILIIPLVAAPIVGWSIPQADRKKG